MGHIRSHVVDVSDIQASPRLNEPDFCPSHRGWYLVIAVALGLALVSWATNITSQAQLSGEANGFLTFRYTFSKLANSGTAWAGLGIVCGWFVRRPLQAAAAGILGSLLSLVAHYAVGRASGMFTADIWSENLEWFVAAIIFGGPLGLIGTLARRPDAWGLAAGLVIPAGAVLEPFVIGMFTLHPLESAPHRISSTITGIVLLLGGALMGATILKRTARLRRAPR